MTSIDQARSQIEEVADDKQGIYMYFACMAYKLVQL